MNGHISHSAYKLAMTIDNTEVLYKEAWIICEDYRQGNETLMDSIEYLNEFLICFGYEEKYEDIKEYILGHEE